MAINLNYSNLSKISKQEQLRFDPKYRHFWDMNKGFLFDTNKYIQLRNVISEQPISKISKGFLDKECELLNLSDQKPKSINLSSIENVSYVGSTKNILNKADLIISKLGLPKGYIFADCDGKFKNLIGSSELIPYSVNKNIYYPKFLKYLLQLDYTLKQFSCLENGKTPSHKRVNPNEIILSKIPLVPITQQTNVLIDIEKLENHINKLYSRVKEPLEIINHIFADYYGFDNSLWLNFGKKMSAGTQKSKRCSLNYYHLPQKQLNTNQLFRFSARFHSPLMEQMSQILKSKKTRFLASVLTQKIGRGFQPQIDEDGEIKVLKTGQLKNGWINLLEAETVNIEFYNKHQLAQIQANDVLICSTGKVSIGKTDISEFEDELMVDGHISILRIKQDVYNAKFLTYFLRSILGTFQIERDYTGTTNQIELYPSEIGNFLIPDIPLPEQNKIARDIETELNQQNTIEKSILKYRQDIDNVIINAIKK